VVPMDALNPMSFRFVAVVACCALVAGPVRAGEAPAGTDPASAPAQAEVDTSSFWFPWQGVLIGTVAGGAGGYFLSRSSCGGGGTVLSCDGLAVIGTVSLAMVGALVGGLVQGLLFWPQHSVPSKPLGAMSVSLFPSVGVEGSTSLNLAVRF
jgi:hypothetical protein